MVWLILIGGLVLFVAVTWELCAEPHWTASSVGGLTGSTHSSWFFAWRPTAPASVCANHPTATRACGSGSRSTPGTTWAEDTSLSPCACWVKEPWATIGSTTDARSLRSEGSLSSRPSRLLFLPPTYIHLMDPGLAILSLPFVLNGLVARRTWTVWLPAALYAFCLILRPHWVNASARCFPLFSFSASWKPWETAPSKNMFRISTLFEMAMYAAAAVTLKNILVPGTCLIVGIYFALEAISRRNLYRSSVAGAVFGLMFILLLSPWLVSSYFASGTPLYPLLGAGFRANPMVEIPHLPSIKDLVTKPPLWIKALGDPRPIAFFFMGGLGLASILKCDPRDRRSTAYVAFFLGVLPIIFLYAAAFGGEFMRYTSNYIVSFLIVSLARLLGGEEERAWLDRIVPNGWRLLGGGLILATLAGGVIHCVRLPQTARMVRKAIRGTGWKPDAGLSAYRRMQSSIPPGESFLAFVPMAHLLDFCATGSTSWIRTVPSALLPACLCGKPRRKLSSTCNRSAFSGLQTGRSSGRRQGKVATSSGCELGASRTRER